MGAAPALAVAFQPWSCSPLSGRRRERRQQAKASAGCTAFPAGNQPRRRLRHARSAAQRC